MGLTQQTISTHDSITAEYAIYTFQRTGGENRGLERWQKHDTAHLLPEAIKKAQSLYESGQYCKVEIKQKQANQRTDTTLKTFEDRPKRPLKAAVMAALTAIFSGIAFTVTYYLGLGQG